MCNQYSLGCPETVVGMRAQPRNGESQLSFGALSSSSSSSSFSIPLSFALHYFRAALKDDVHVRVVG